MQLLNDKIDGSGSPENILPAAEWNQLPSELQNIITALGMTLSNGDLNQLGKALAGYVANGAFYTDSGVADAYVLTPLDGKQSPPAYTDGMIVEFIAGNDNTGVSNVNVAGLGAKGVRTEDGLVVIAGMISGRTSLRYDDGAGWFVIQLSDEWFVNTTLHADISTASPPTTESVTAIHRVVDRTGANLLAEMGFSANENLRIKNHMEGANTQLWGVESGGVARLLFDGVPGGRSTMHFDSDPTARTAATASGGLEIDNQLTGAGFERALTESDNPVYRKVRTANKSLSSTSTLEVDADLSSIPIEAGKLYEVSFTLLLGAADADPKFKFNIDITGGISFDTQRNGTVIYSPSSGTPAIEGLEGLIGTTFSGIDVGLGSSIMTFTGVFKSDLVGVMNFEWAQNVSDATAFVVYAGSTIQLRKLN